MPDHTADVEPAPAELILARQGRPGEAEACFHRVLQMQRCWPPTGASISLDPFPFSGGLTTCVALWMGVPVVTYPGETFAGRHSLSHLSNIGLTETIAPDLAHYVDIAVGLACDPRRLTELRATLRPRMAQSPLCDGPRSSPLPR